MDRILIISHSVGGPSLGPNIRIYQLGKILSLNNSVEILASQQFHKYNYTPKRRIVYNKNFRVKYLHNVNYTNSIGQLINQIVFAFGVSVQLLKYRRSLDVLIFSSPPPLALILVPKFVQRKKCRFILDIRDLWPELLEELYPKRTIFTSFYSSIIEKVIVKNYAIADKIISVKEGDIDFIKSNYRTKGNVHFIPNCYSLPEGSDEDFSKQIDVSEIVNDNLLTITYAGSLSNYYSLKEIITATQIVNSLSARVQLIIFGDGKELPKYRQLAKNENEIVFLGKRSKDIVLAVLEESDIGYLTIKQSKYNSHGISTNKLYDYMFSKIPILAFCSSRIDIIEDIGFQCNDSKIESLVALLEHILSWEKDALKYLGEAGYSKLLDSFLAESVFKNYLD